MTLCYTNVELDDLLMKIHGKRKVPKHEHIPYDTLFKLEKIASNQFTARQKECFLLYYIKNNNLKQVAYETNLSIPTVCRHLQRARKKIYNELKYFSEAKNMWN